MGTSTRITRGVVVAVAPTGDHDAALEYAADQAIRRGCPIHLVVVLHPRTPGPDGWIELELIGEDLVRVDAATLSECEQRLHEWTGGNVTVTTEVAHGQVVPSLVASSREAQLVVLQHHRMSRPFHLPTLSVTNGVASRASVPVVAVPDGWHARAEQSGPVLAAVESACESRAVVEEAAAQADLLRASLRIVHAWSVVDEDLPMAATADETSAQLEARLAEELGGLVEAGPDVPLEIVAAHGQPAYVLVNAATEARQVVIGRHDPTLPWGSHLGPVTRSVLTHADCPVEVVDTRPATTS